MEDYNFKKDKYNIDDLIRIMEILRSENGCMWDREQNHHTIRENFLEEVYEVLEAIDMDDKDMLLEELGDVLLQVVFHSRISEEDNQFNFNDVTDGICKKLIHRHPHVFGEVKVSNSTEILNNWDNIKKSEKSQETYTDTLNSVPKVLPALMYSTKVQKRAAKAGFDWDSVHDPLLKISEELSELTEAIEEGNEMHISEELGDLLFAIVNVSRFIHVDSEKALTDATKKFIKRFSVVESLANEQGVNMNESTLYELDKLWEKAKNILN